MHPKYNQKRKYVEKKKTRGESHKIIYGALLHGLTDSLQSLILFINALDTIAFIQVECTKFHTSIILKVKNICLMQTRFTIG